MKYLSDALFILLGFVLIVLFSGEPDLMDGVVSYVNGLTPVCVEQPAEEVNP